MIALAKPDSPREQTLPVDQVLHGDCIEMLKRMPSDSLDCCVTDPPYGLSKEPDIREVLQHWLNGDRYEHKQKGFMGKSWDSFVPGPEYWCEVYRVLKPGAHLLAFGGTRTYDMLVIAIRLAGFECRDMLMWLHGQGFPKSLNLGNGRGSALKPAQEPIILARKPLAEKSIAAQVLSTGTGGLAIDKCRVGTNDYTGRPSGQSVNAYEWSNKPNPMYGQITGGSPQGRFPSHLLLSHSLFCQPAGTKRVKQQGGGTHETAKDSTINAYGKYNQRSMVNHAPDGYEQVDAYLCDDSCPIGAIDRQSGVRKSHTSIRVHKGSLIGNGNTHGNMVSHYEGDNCGFDETGGASRYFQCFPPTNETNFPPDVDSPDFVPFHYFSKASRANRSANGTVNNIHPTTKNTELMRWLIRLITPPGGIVLDCFAGSGSTLVAAIQENVHWIGIEQSQEYVAICEARIQHALHNPPDVVQVGKKKVKGNSPMGHKGNTTINDYGKYENRSEVTHGMEEEVEDWDCSPECPIRILGQQAGESTDRDGKHPNAKVLFGSTFREPVDNVTRRGETGSKARYFQQFPPDSLFAECTDEDEDAQLTQAKRELGWLVDGPKEEVHSNV